MSITDNEEYKQDKAIVFKDYWKLPEPQLTRIKDQMSTCDVGARIAENILTAQHDKETEESAEWVHVNPWRLNEFEGRKWWRKEGDFKNQNRTTSELLQLFRERNGK